MSTEPTATIPLIFESDPSPNYNWFGNFSFEWFDSPGDLSSLPFFESAAGDLARLLQASSSLHTPRLSFGPLDCTTVAGTKNCTEACSDPSSLFTPHNFRVCTSLAGAALLVQNGTLSVDSSDQQTLRVIGEWRIPTLSTYNATGVVSQITKCIPESCILSDLGECADDVRSLATLEVNTNNLEALSASLEHYCDGVEMQINPDIAGPGVRFFVEIPHLESCRAY